MDENNLREQPWDAGRVLREALIRSALDSAEQAWRAGADRGVPRPGPAFRLRPAPGPDRGRHRQQGHRRVVGGAGRAAAGRGR
ncbi:hypothetical protein G6F35_018678 [Rhizopus arrhizus]|nr:hypothetical protein G6F35_018678 [Rhizopus arrhizus]